MVLLIVSLASAGVTAEESAQLAAGGVVLRTKTPRREGAVRVEAIIDVKATSEAVWAALLDFPARMRTNTSLKKVQTYRAATASEQWVSWEAERFGTTIRYHNHYILSADHRTLTHELDPTQTNDLVWSYGVYRLSADASCSGCTRLDYDVESDFGVAIPSMITRWLTSSGVRDFMSDIARRAEGG